MKIKEELQLITLKSNEAISATASKEVRDWALANQSITGYLNNLMRTAAKQGSNTFSVSATCVIEYLQMSQEDVELCRLYYKQEDIELTYVYERNMFGNKLRSFILYWG